MNYMWMKPHAYRRVVRALSAIQLEAPQLPCANHGQHPTRTPPHGPMQNYPQAVKQYKRIVKCLEGFEVRVRGGELSYDLKRKCDSFKV